jgi:molecular chaperone GrpE
VTEEEKESLARSTDGATDSKSPAGSADEAAAAGDALERELAELGRELAEARSKANTYLDLAQRTQADFVNFKRRTEQERSEYARGARGDIVARLLGPLDDLDRAVASLPSGLADNDWAQGVVLIARKFHSALDALGVRPIEAEGKPFDPYQEEAVAREPSQAVPAESVTQVVRSGYAIDGRVIRPAQVVVSSGPATQEHHS